MLRQNFPNRKKIKCASAKERQEFSATQPYSEQVARLDRRLGKGLGAVKERARLAGLEAKIIIPVKED